MTAEPPRPVPERQRQRSPEPRQAGPPPASSSPSGGGPEAGGTGRPLGPWRKMLLGAAALMVAGVATATMLGTGRGGDQSPTAAQRAEIEQSWQRVQASRVMLLPVPPGDREAAYRELTRLEVPEAKLRAIQQEVERGTLELVTFTLWDNVAEDGDIVQLETPELTVRVPLLHARATIPLVRPAGGVVNIRGIYDGGGGITMGIMANNVPVLLPPLQPNQLLGIPVR